jgi:hypothetical protein
MRAFVAQRKEVFSDAKDPDPTSPDRDDATAPVSPVLYRVNAVAHATSRTQAVHRYPTES